MKKLSAALIILFGLANAALAQQFTMPPPAGVMIGGYVVVASCGSHSYTAGIPAMAEMDTSGNICSNGGSGGGTVAISQATPGTTNLVQEPDAALPAAGIGTYTCSATCNTTNSGVLTGSIDTSGYSSFILQITSTAASDQTIIETSNDGTTWYTVPSIYLSSTTQSVIAANTTNILGTFVAPNIGRYVRVRALAYSSGTMAGTYVLRKSYAPITQNVILNDLYPTGAVRITGNATGTTGAVVGTLANTGGKTTYICGFNVSAIGGTAAVGPIVIAGLITSSMTYQLASTASGNTLAVPFNPCIPASAPNTAITITTTADGTASAVSVNSWGYQQ